MNSFILIEYVLVGVIILLQTGIFYKTFQQIKFFKSAVPPLDFFKIKKYLIPIEDLQSLEPKEILKRLKSYDYHSKKEELIPQSEPIAVLDSVDSEASNNPNLFNQNGSDHSKSYSNDLVENSSIELSLVSPNEETNIVFDSALNSINTYLIRNKGSVTDFNLIKDIVERNTDSIEEDINISVAIPLYLGLMGTMIGIVIGLFNMSDLTDTSTNIVSDNIGKGITVLLGGVKVAMLASFFGLGYTVFNSGFVFKGSRRIIEARKNDFYTFIQTELLPILNQSISSSVYTLHHNLVKFNENFTVNLNRLSGLLHKNHDALIAQENILSSLENLNITEFAKANVKVLKELKMGTEQLEKFNSYIHSLNEFAVNTKRLSISFEELLSKSNNFKGLAEKLDGRVDESNRLIEFLNTHFSALDERKQLIVNSLISVDDLLQKSFEELKDHTHAKMQAIKEITIREEDMMSKALSDNRNNLTKLSYLEDLNKQVGVFKDNSATHIEKLTGELKDLNGQLNLSISILQDMKKNNLLQQTKYLSSWIKRKIGLNGKSA